MGLLLQLCKSGWGCCLGLLGHSHSPSGFGTIPEDNEVFLPPTGELARPEGYERKAEAAILSWRMGDKVAESQSAALALSSDNSTIDLKDFLSKREKGAYFLSHYCFGLDNSYI